MYVGMYVCIQFSTQTPRDESDSLTDCPDCSRFRQTVADSIHAARHDSTRRDSLVA